MNNNNSDQPYLESDSLNRIFRQFSHDLSTPIMGLGISRDQRNNPSLNAKTRERAEKRIATASVRISELVTEFLEDALGIVDPKNIKLGKINPSEIAIDAMKIASLIPSTRQIESGHMRKLPMIDGDHDKLLRVFENLLTNAIKYSPEKSTITVSVDSEDSNTVTWRVADQGPGIPAISRKSIFEEGVRLYEHRNRKGKGIGLSFCRQVVECHHGRMWVEPNAGRGSVFCVTLPFKQEN